MRQHLHDACRKAGSKITGSNQSARADALFERENGVLKKHTNKEYIICFRSPEVASTFTRRVYAC